jgi:crotonobetainyl-CoA:carnitine CoA-transferase CaiB-like acyl-CoA transferase
MSDRSLPLAGLRVVEFTHMVMGPACGLILGDLGADVVKIEPVTGDSTRRLKGSGSGFFPTFNRNKKSLALNLQHPDGAEIALRLACAADVVIENFRPDTMRKLGLDYLSLSRLSPRLIYVSHKGFLPGPYENRTALDEVVQMMGGLAYMTGPEGRPLRAGSSVNDIMGGMFGAIGVMAALRQRDESGRGQLVQSGLFENNVFLVAQHMMQYAVTGEPAAPMPSRISAWAIYDVFTVADGEQIFLAVVSDSQWRQFCDSFGFEDLKTDPHHATNESRVAARDTLIPTLRKRLAHIPGSLIREKFEAGGMPFAPIARPHELLDDPHLNQSGGFAPVRIPGSPLTQNKVPLLPVIIDGGRPPLRLQPPLLGEHTDELLQSLGYSEEEVQRLRAEGVAG